MLRIFTSLFFIGLLLWLMRDNVSSILLSLKSTNIPLFHAGLFLFWGTLAIASFRLKKILSTQGIYISFMEVLKLTLVGYFFNNFLPSSVGGDVVKAYYTSMKTEKKLASVTSIFVDRLIGFVGLVAMATVVLMFWDAHVRDRRIVATVIIILCVLMGLIILLILASGLRNFRPLRRFLRSLRLEAPIRRFVEVVKVYNNNRMLMQNMLCLSVLAHSLGATGTYVLAKSLSLEVSLWLFFLLVPIIVLASMFPSLNGLGVREGAYVYYLGPIVGKENAFALSILGLALLLINSIIGGLVYACCKDFRLVHSKEPKG